MRDTRARLQATVLQAAGLAWLFDALGETG